MNRQIVGFGVDEAGDPFARLDCGHRQHVRHKPPFFNRPWVASQEGRDSMLGSALDCVLCDRMEWPEGLTAYRRLPEMDETNIPAGLKRDHATKRGVWAKIKVLEGSVEYCVQEPVNQSFQLVAPCEGVVVPEVRHHLQVRGRVRMYIEFWRSPDAHRGTRLRASQLI